MKEKSTTYIRGLAGLAKFLGCGINTALRLKNEGRVPYFQSGKLLLFDPKQVHEALFSGENEKGLTNGR